MKVKLNKNSLYDAIKDIKYRIKVMEKLKIIIEADNNILECDKTIMIEYCDYIIEKLEKHIKLLKETK